MGFAQRFGELGFAFETDAKRFRAELGEGEHLAGDLEHRGVGAEGKGFLGSAEREAVVAELGGTHHPGDVTLSRLAEAVVPILREPEDMPWGG